MSKGKKTPAPQEQGQPAAGGEGQAEQAAVYDPFPGTDDTVQLPALPDGATNSNTVPAVHAPPGYRLMPIGKRGKPGVRNVSYIIAAHPRHNEMEHVILWTGKSKVGAQRQLDQLGGAIYGAFVGVRVLRCRDITEEMS